MSLVIYKAIFGNYDSLPKEPNFCQKNNYEFKLFTDKDIKVNGWEVIKLKINDPIIANRHCKMFPWDYFNSNKSLYLDGHIEFGPKFEDFLEKINSMSEEMILLRHRSKGTIKDEFIRAIDNSKLSYEEIDKILTSCILLDRPSPECGLIMRNHESHKVRVLSEKWWEYFNSICKRDQISVQTAANHAELNIKVLEEDFSNKDYFKMTLHKNTIRNLILNRMKIALRIIRNGLLLKRSS